MKRLLIAGMFCSLALVTAGTVMAKVAVGQPAPAFTATDGSGKPISLSKFKGKFVVLEWVNPECPFSQKHYNGGNIPETGKKAMAEGAVWLSIQTTPGGDDDKARSDLRAWLASKNAAPTALIIDSSGNIGRTYGARTTPHMYIVDPKGTLIYAGAIDSKPSSNPAHIRTATNYVAQALGEAMSGKPVSRSTTQPYGCTVKYPGGA